MILRDFTVYIHAIKSLFQFLDITSLIENFTILVNKNYKNFLTSS